MPHTSNQDIFETLKQALKAQKKTYRELADQLGVSEPTIKRIFSEKDCKLSRILDICELLGLEPQDILELASRRDEQVQHLSIPAEIRMAKYPALFYFYILLRDGLTEQDIAEHFQLSESDTYLYMRDLEKFDLVKLAATGEYTLSSEAPLKIRPDGPLYSLYCKINTEFVTKTLARENHNPGTFISLSRKMRRSTAELLLEDIDAFEKRLNRLSRQDKLTSPEHELVTMKWTIAVGKVEFKDFASISKRIK